MKPWKIEEQYANLPVVALVGRTNVGKSTLFNKLTENNQALVSDIENTTRDSNLGIVKWRRQKFLLVDTAGVIDSRFLSDKKYVNHQVSEVETQTQKQVSAFFKRASVIIFLVDGKTGLVAQDKEIAHFLQKRPHFQDRTILAVNKVDGKKQAWASAEFNRLGLGDPQLISALTGRGTGDLLDVVSNQLIAKSETKADIDEEVIGHPINVCIIGQPNVGKSSLLNSILGYERVIVSPLPHTTREPQHTEIIYQGQRIRFVDTAGISKHGHQGESLAKEGISKSLKILKKADIALLVLDINIGITHQDAKIVEEIMESRKSFMILANKWDLVETRDTKKWTNYVFRYLPFATWAPLQFISAKTGAKVDKIMALILEMNEARHRQVSDSQLDKFLGRIVKIHLPTKGKGSKKPRLYEIRQSGVRPPRFEVRIGAKEDLDYSYLRFIENQLRIQFDLTGIPIRVRVIKKSLLPSEIKEQKELKKQAA